MKDRKPAKLFSTPLRMAIVFGAIVMLTEYFFMITLRGLLIPLFPSMAVDNIWDAIDAVVLTSVLSIAFYFLAFRRLRDDEVRLRKFHDAALSAIVVVDAEARITSWNPAAEKMFQYRAEEVLGQPMHQLIAPSRYHAEAARGFVHFQENGEGPLLGKVTEVAALRKDGSEFPIELSLAAVELGGHRHAIGVINDISERKRAEAQLQASEQRNRGIFEAVLDGIALVDLETQALVSVNPALCRMLGYRPEEFTRLKVADLHRPQDWPQVQAQFEKQARGEVPLAANVPVKRKDESVFYADINAVPIDLGGKQYMLGVFRDITEKKSAEARLRLFHEMIDQAGEGIFLADPATGRFLEVNETACRSLGYTREELLQHSVLDVQRDITDQAAWQAHAQTLRAQGAALLQFETVRKDGSHFPTEVGLRYVSSENQSYILAVVRDITERKQAEAALRASESRFRAFTDHSSDLTSLVGADGVIRYLSPASQPLLGYAEGELNGCNISEIIHPDDLNDVHAALAAAWATAGAVQRVEHRMRDKNGGWHVFESKGTYVPMLDGVVANSRDITERKQMEQSAIESAHKLSMLLDSITDSIFIVGVDGHIIKTNLAVSQRLGFSQEELQQMNAADIDTPEFAAKVPERIQALQVQGELTFETAHVSKAGVVIPMEVNSRVVDYDGKPAILSVSRDITQRKQSEQALRLSESRLRVILESTADGILAVDREGKVLTINQRFAELWKIPPALIASGDDQALLAHVLEQLAEPDAFLKQVQSLYASDATSLDLINFKDGRCFERFSSAMLEGAAIVGRVWSFRDITARRQAEANAAEQVLELQRWHEVTLGREERILELKHEVNQLQVEAGQAPRYPSAGS